MILFFFFLPFMKFLFGFLALLEALILQKQSVRNVFCQGGGEGVWLNKHSRASPNVRATIHKKMNYSAFYNKVFSS